MTKQRNYVPVCPVLQRFTVTGSSSYSTPNFLLVPAGNKRQDDITGPCGPSTPTPTSRASRWTTSHPSIHPASFSLSLCLWEHDFITEMNCLIVKTQLPPFAGEGWASLDIGASCGDPASGVSSPTVWKASHVTHHWMTAPHPSSSSSQPRALSQPRQASERCNHSCKIWLHVTKNTPSF